MALGSLASLGALVVGEACRAPTQVTLELDFRGASCGVLRSVAIVVADDANVAEQRVSSGDYSTTTAGCVRPDGHIGTLVLTPGDRERGAVVVVAGVDRPPEECRPANGYFGCIVARRAFAFIEHTPLRLPVSLDFTCKNVPCDAVSTCKTGGCVSSEVAAAGESFVEPGAPQADGAIPYVDAPTSTDGADPYDAARPPPVDAGSDAGSDADDGGACAADPATIQCGSGALRCAKASQVCVYGTAIDGGGGWSCQPTGSGGTFVKSCSTNANCAIGEVCCQYASVTQCVGGMPVGVDAAPIACAGQRVCEQTCDCGGVGACGPGGGPPGMTVCQ